MTKVLVDTNIIIDFTKGKSKDLKFLFEKQEEGKINLYVNPVIISEFFTDRNLKNGKKLQKARDFFNLFDLANITKEVGFLAGELLREGKVNFLGDALIAATCLYFNLQLATKDKKDFTKIKQLTFFIDELKQS